MSTSATSLIFDLLGRDVSASATVQAFGAEVEKSSASASAAFGKAATGITVAAAAAVAESIRMAGDFQSQMVRLVTAAGENESNLQAVSDGVLNISKQTGVSTTDLAAGMYQIESAGFHGANGLDVMKAAAQGAQIESANVTTVSNALTTALDDMHLPATEAANVMSQMVAAVGQGKMTMDDLAGSLHSVLPNATALGLSFPQVTGALAEMTSQGMSADQAAQNLNHTIVSLASPTQAMTTAMAAYGLQSQTVAKNLGTEGLTGTMTELSSAVMSKMGPAGVTLLNSFNQSQAAANDLQVMLKSLPASMQASAQSFLNGTTSFADFRKEVRNTGGVSEATGTQFLALAQKADGFNSILASGNNASQTYTAAMKSILGDQTNLQVAMHLTGAAAAGFNDKVQAIGAASADAGGNVNDWTTKQKTLNIQIAELTANVKVAMIELGTKMIPDVTEIVHLLTQHIDVVAKVVIGLVAFGVAYKTVQVAIKLAHAAQLAFNGLMIVTKGIYMATQGAMLGFKAAMLGAQVLTEVQTASLERSTVAMVAFKAAQLAGAAATWVMNAAQTALDFILDANPIVLIIAALVALGIGLYEAYEHSTTFRNIVKAAFTDVKNVTLDVVHALETAWNDVWGAVSSAWNSVGKPIFDVIVDVVKVWFDIQKETFIAALLIVGGLFYGMRDLWNAVGKPLFDTIVSVVKAIWNNGVKPIFNLWLDQWKLLWSLMQGAWNTVGVPVFNAVKTLISDVASVVEASYNDVIKPAFDLWLDQFKLIWTVMQDVWASVGAPVFSAIEVATSGVGNGLKWAYNNVILPVWGLFQGAWNGIKGGWDALLQDMGQISGAVLGGIKGAINEVIDLINDMIRALNSIHMTLPSISIPGVGTVGGETIGLHIPQIPRLSAGATINATPGGTLALLAEAGKSETVVDSGLMNGVLASVLSDQQQRQARASTVGQHAPTIIQLTMPLYYGNADQASREVLQALQRLKGQGVQTNLG